MKKFFRNPILNVLAASLVLGLIGPITAFAATSPTLSGATSYSVLGSSTVTNTGSSVISGAVGVSTGTAITGFPPATAGGGTHSNDLSAQAAQTDNVAAFSTLNQSCDQSYADGQDLTLLSPLGPGVYCSAGSFALTGNLNLTGSGVWIFKSASTLITSTGSSVTGGDPCNIWWRVGSSATLGTSTSFVGNILALASITMNTSATLNGRAMAQTAAVTLDTNTISGPVCALPPPPSTATLHVVKTVVNDNGGTTLASAFNLHVKLSGTDVVGSPMGGVATPGRSYTLATGTYNVSEDTNASYTQSFSGDCDASGNVVLASGNDKTCTITNNDIAVVPGSATLHVVKTVVNDNGGTTLASAFNLHVKLAGVEVALSPAAGVASPGKSYTLAAGTYVVSEDANSGYTATFSGDCNLSGSVALVAGDNKTCTITNNDIAPIVIPPTSGTIKVVKTVINDNGKTKTVADFSLFVNGTQVVSGVTNVFPAGAYTMAETADTNYTATFSGDCDYSGHLNIIAGDSKTCTITNNDIAAVVAPVVAAPVYVTPILPSTGVAPMENGAPWNIVIMAGILMSVVALKKGKI
ncbi:MAG: ice-binding family protein [Candidatus Gracilibacteria bacterium]|jgi:hypothetical protein